jgi:hypothetical protein
MFRRASIWRSPTRHTGHWHPAEHLEPAAGLDLMIDRVEPLGSESLVHRRLTVKLACPVRAGDRLSVTPRARASARL